LPAGVGDAQNDVAAPTFLAYRKERFVADCLDSELALLAASSSQALWATDRSPAPPLRALLDRVRELFPPVDDPSARRIGEELGRLAQEFGRAARTGAGALA
jgi:hypothetical protein